MTIPTPSPAPDQFVVITNREVYEAVVELGRKLDPLPATLTDHETRIRSLERKVWGAAGVAGVAGATVTALASALRGGA